MPTFTTFDGIDLAYTDDGDGPAVVLLHGFTADTSLNFVRPGVADRLTGDGFRVLGLDARGHGRSDKPTDVESYAGDAAARDVVALLDHLGLERVLLVGYSMGGYTALRCSQVDSRIAAIVLLGLGAAEDQPGLREERRANFLAALDTDDPGEQAGHLGEFRLMAGLDPAPLVAQLKAADPRAALRPERVAVPLLMITGDDDTVAGDPEPLAAHLDASLVRVPGNHFNAHASARAHQEMLAFLGAQ